MPRNPRRKPGPNRLKELRKEDGMLGVELARRVGVDPATISRWENRKDAIPDEYKERLAAMFKVSVAFLMYWDQEHAGNGENGNGNGDSEVA